jgi:hypothetical protein
MPNDNVWEQWQLLDAEVAKALLLNFGPGCALLHQEKVHRVHLVLHHHLQELLHGFRLLHLWCQTKQKHVLKAHESFELLYR